MELRAIKGLWSDLLCIGDGFNIVRFPRECISATRLFVVVRRFPKVVKDLQLRDLPLFGGLLLGGGLK